MDFKKQILPHLIALGVFLLLAIGYFSPVLQGKKMKQHDISMFNGTVTEMKKVRDNTGEPVLWLPDIFGGMPSFQHGAPSNSNVTQYIDTYLFRVLPRPADYVFLYFVGFYLFMLMLGVSPYLSIVGAIAFSFGTYNFIILEAGHTSKANVIGYMAPLIGSIIFAYRKHLWLGAAMAAFFTAISIEANHFQITYYTIIIMFVYAIYEFINAMKGNKLPDFVKKSGVLIIAGLLGVMANTTALWTTLEFADSSMRGGKSELKENTGQEQTGGLARDYAMTWSLGKMESFVMIFPNFYGGASGRSLDKSSNTYKAVESRAGKVQATQISSQIPMYWGEQPIVSGPPYIGVISIFLAVLALFVVGSNLRWWFLSITMIALVLSWGRHFSVFNDIVFDIVPLYNKFRVPSMILVVIQLSVPALGFWGLSEIIKGKVNKEKLEQGIKNTAVVLGSLAAIAFIFSLVTDAAGPNDERYFGNNPWLIDAIVKDRIGMIRMDVIKFLCFCAIGLALIWGFMKQKMSSTILIGALAVLVLGDLWLVNREYVNNDNFVSASKFKNPNPITAANQQILADKDPHFRVHNTTIGMTSDGMTPYHHKIIGGYSAAKMQRYQDLIDNHLSQGNQAVYNMLNTKYFIVANEKGEQMVQRNPQVMGNAWFVSNVKMVQNAKAEIDALTGFNPKQTAFVHEEFEKYLSGMNPSTTNATIQLTNYHPDHMIYTVSGLNKDAFAVFSEVYYKKGWKAIIDGKEVDHIRTNYLLRGLNVPAGSKQVEFHFEPNSYYTGEIFSMSSSLLILLVLIGGGYMWFKSKKSEV